mmetsp:Transcript_10316/g.16636  ORF Transcript_10316/g.16636 Transcript_10316/m.16636 type:complete len:140 (+) Transcript_10316:484-903(+)
MEKLKELKEKGTKGLFGGLKNLGDLRKKAAAEGPQTVAVDVPTAAETTEQETSTAAGDRPASAEPEYESPTADERSKRSNKRTESLAPESQEERQGDAERPASAEPEYESPTADEKSRRSNKRTESLAPESDEEAKEEL